MAHVGTDSPLSTGAARTGRLRVECSRDGQTRLLMRFFCAFALAKLAKMEAQHRQTLKNSRILIAREKNSVDSPHRRWNFTLHTAISRLRLYFCLQIARQCEARRDFWKRAISERACQPLLL